jgi:DNA-binding transcriptional LysR family regulator
MDRSDITLERMRIFVRVAERANLSAVARELGIGQSTVTRQLRELEDALGVPLVSRTTRRLNLTAEGSAYYAQCIQILRLVEQANDDARTARDGTSGTVRLSCTAALGVLHIGRILFAFQERHPDVEVDFSLSDDRIDLVREGFDLSLRLGPLSDSSMKLRALGQSSRILAAAPGYLDRQGRPRSPGELAGHKGIRMSNIAGSDILALTDRHGHRHLVPFGGKLMVDHGLAAREAMLAQCGIAAAHRWLIDDLLQTGRVEQILPDYSVPSVALSMLIVPERTDTRRVRLLADFLAEQIRTIPGIVP